MGGRRSLVRVLAAGAALVAASAVVPAPVPAQASDVVQVAVVRSMYTPGDDELGPPTLHLPQGSGITLTNLDTFAAHSLSSDYIDPVSGERLFDSAALNFRASGPVVGVTTLAPGSYPFHCTIHEDNMRGVLVVH